MAETLVEAGSAPWGICYHSQQALEKGLKALAVASDTDPRRTHNLVELNMRLDPPVFGEADTALLARLTVLATVQRYPADLPDVTVVQAREAVALAQRGLENIAARLASESQPPQLRRDPL